MFNNFEEAERFILSQPDKKRIALCCAHDRAALSAVVDARRKGVAEATLVGDEDAIRSLLRDLGESEKDYAIVEAGSDLEASMTAMELVRDGGADIEMKGHIPSADFLLPIMNPFGGLVEEGSLMSETTAFCYDGRVMFATDCAMTIAPSLEQKESLIRNAVDLARAFGFDEVRVAAISALEKVNPQIPSTEDADALSHMDFGDAVHVTGPFALDNAIDGNCAREKGIDSPVAGKADVLLMPDLCAGNVFHKCLHYLGHVPSAAVVCGTTKPVVFTSRSDTAQTKYYSILAALLQAQTS